MSAIHTQRPAPSATGATPNSRWSVLGAIDMRKVCGIRRDAKAPWRLRPNVFLGRHDPRDAIHAERLALRLQLLVHPRTAVRPATRLVNRPNLLREVRIRGRVRTRRPGHPRIVPGLRHREHPAHGRDVELRGVVQDERESHRACLEKKAVAFPKMSRSSRSTVFSRRNRRISSSWLVSFPFPGKISGAPRPACSATTCRHWYSVSGRIPSSARHLAHGPIADGRQAHGLHLKLSGELPAGSTPRLLVLLFSASCFHATPPP